MGMMHIIIDVEPYHKCFAVPNFYEFLEPFYSKRYSIQATEQTIYLWVKEKNCDDSAYHTTLLLPDFDRFGTDRESH